MNGGSTSIPAPASAAQGEATAAISTADGRRVLGVVITYNPGPDLARNLEALRGQVDALAVIDNGSSNVAFVENVVVAVDGRLIRNGANLGIAAALSQGARLAASEGFDWLATFDQDSLMPDGSIGGLIDLYDTLPDPAHVAVIAMSRRDLATGRDYHFAWDILSEAADWRAVRSTITSGSLVRVEIFARVGLFDDSLFIDSVDHEFCLRCRKHGLLIVEAKHLIMHHAKGQASEHQLLWLKVPTANHSALRRYYITRNQLEVFRRYFTFDPVWVAFYAFLLVCEAVLIALFERGKREKFAAMATGARDVVQRRFGPRAD